MPVQGVDVSGQRADDGERTSEAAKSGPAVPHAWRNKRFRLAVIGAAVVLAAGIGFGVGRVMGLGNTVILTAIPKPWAGSEAFIESGDGTALDNQGNILDSTALGMVHVLSGGTPAGMGLVLTQSGKVLTTYQPAAGASGLTAKYVLSGATFKATVIGEADGLTLLQMQGPAGRAFATVSVGNSATIVAGSYASRETSYHVPGEVIDTEVGTSGTNRNVTIDLGTLINLNASVTANGRTRSGLMESALESVLSVELGGPLVDLNGRVIGITVAETGSERNPDGYAIPINTALAIAAQIDNGNS
jgi:S1-C subfamily serine protease